jgi:hypothetical protein
MMRTIVIRVDTRPASLEDGSQVPVYPLDHRFGEISAGDAGLVRDDDHAKAGVIERTDRIDRPGIERHLVEASQVADVLDERAVSIEKHRTSAGRGHHNDRRAASATAWTAMPVMHR